MDHSDSATPDTSMEAHDTTNRRKSGRVRQAPLLLSRDPNLTQDNGNGGKRKRTKLRGGDMPDASGEEGEDEESDVSESDPDEEELKERRKKASNKATSKPAPKKTKMAGSAPTKLAVRPAANGIVKASKAQRSKARPAAVAGDGTGLYCRLL